MARKKQQGGKTEREKKGNASCQTVVKWEKFSLVITQTIHTIIVKQKYKYVR